jgi:hypothetical protein
LIAKFLQKLTLPRFYLSTSNRLHLSQIFTLDSRRNTLKPSPEGLDFGDVLGGVLQHLSTVGLHSSENAEGVIAEVGEVFLGL